MAILLAGHRSNTAPVILLSSVFQDTRAPLPKLSWSNGGILPRGARPRVSVRADLCRNRRQTRGGSYDCGNRSGEFWPIAVTWRGLLR